MLYGDDDTFFFMDAVASVVKDLDPEMPYFLSGLHSNSLPNLDIKGQKISVLDA